MRSAETPHRRAINNAFYDDLGDRWYSDDTHAIALLRAESKLKVDYVKEAFARYQVPAQARVLDVACGAGFITLPLSAAGYIVKGIDLSESSLAAARGKSEPGMAVEFCRENALQLRSEAAAFDAVLMLDFLEHIETPEAAIQEAARVLKPGGVMVVHTFNRTLLARLLAIKAIEWFTRDCPEHVHVYDYFIKPAELTAMMERAGLSCRDVRGLRPDFWTPSFWWSMRQRRLHPDFAFTYSRSLAVGYIGAGVKTVPRHLTNQGARPP